MNQVELRHPPGSTAGSSRVSPRLYATACAGDFASHLFFGALSFRAAELHADSWSTGLVGLAGDGTYVLGALFLGRFWDIRSRRVVTMSALTIMALGLWAASMAPTLTTFALAFVFFRVGSSLFWPVVQSRLSDEAPSDLGRAVCAFNLAWALGKCASYCLNSFLFSRGTWSPVDSCALAAVAAMFAIILVPRDVVRPTAERRRTSTQSAPPGATERLHVARLVMFLGACVAVIVLNQAAPILRARGLGEDTGNILLATIVAVQIGVFEWIRRRPHSVGRSGPLVGACGLLVATLVAFLLAKTQFWMVVAAIVAGVGIGVGYVHSLVLSLALPSSAADGAGKHEAVLGAGNALIAPAAGLAAKLLGFADGAIWFGLIFVALGSGYAVFRLRLIDRSYVPGIVAVERSSL